MAVLEILADVAARSSIWALVEGAGFSCRERGSLLGINSDGGGGWAAHLPVIRT